MMVVMMKDFIIYDFDERIGGICVKDCNLNNSMITLTARYLLTCTINRSYFHNLVASVSLVTA